MTSDTDVEFWDSRYREGRTPWDQGGVPVALRRWLGTAPRPGRVLIPGCGFGYEVQAFHAAGWEVLAIDYSPSGVARAREALGELADKVVLADFFANDFGRERFDVVYERTFLCALPPRMWPAYARRMAELLVERGRLVGTFFYGQNDDPPPHPLTPAAADAVLGYYLERVSDEAVTDSLPIFGGKERWQIWEKK